MYLRGKWPARRTTVAPSPSPLLPIEVSIWLRRNSGWLVIFEASHALADATAHLVCAGLLGDPSSVSGMLLHLHHWAAIDDWLKRSSSEGGMLLGGRFYKAQPADTSVEWIAFRQAPGSGETLIRECFETAEGIGELLIQTPYVKAIESSITCRIGRTGNIRIYGTEVSDSVVEALLLELETVWENVPTEFDT
jgi:hypothetical protein